MSDLSKSEMAKGFVGSAIIAVGQFLSVLWVVRVMEKRDKDKER